MSVSIAASFYCAMNSKNGGEETKMAAGPRLGWLWRKLMELDARREQAASAEVASKEEQRAMSGRDNRADSTS